MPKKKKEKEAKIVGVRNYIKGDLEITETVKKVDPTTDFLTTPWGSKVKSGDVVRVLEEYNSLPIEDQEREKKAWVQLISSMMGTREDGLKIVDIEMSPYGNRSVKFIYRKEELL